MLPRKDLVRAKQYFIIDAACAAIAYTLHQVRKLDNSFYVFEIPPTTSIQAENFFIILFLQQCQHIYYYTTWDKSGPTKVDNKPHFDELLCLSYKT